MHAFSLALLQLAQPLTVPGTPIAAAPPEGEPILVHFADLTGDGLADRLTLDRGGCLAVSVNQGNRTFAEIRSELPAVLAVGLLVEDLDGDRLPDLFFATTGASVALRNLGQGRFAAATDELGLADRGPGESVEAADVDGDGQRDIVLHNEGHDVVFWREADGAFARERVGGPGTVVGLSLVPGGPSTAPLATQLHARPVPPGTILPYGGVSAPPGYLLCDGSEVDRSDYARLFAVIGTLYGDGNGVETFELPNLEQRFLLGKADSGTGATLAETGGQIDHTHATPQHQHSIAANSHEHGLNNHTHSLAGHTHSIPAHFHDTQGPGATISIASNASARHPHDIGGKANNSGTGNSNRFVIADGSGTDTRINAGSGSPPGNAGEHGHDHASFTGQVGNVSSSNNGDVGLTSGGPSAGSTGASSGSTSGHGAFSTNLATGGDTSAANPPYLVVNFIIKT